ncbi:hypothetical protein KAR91_45290 [Candidatus Pacearchaeota archaeon]|jgi:hypothetical protein|nr:hypothetical protein [Candidatus Pacearchaeota archaeon]
MMAFISIACLISCAPKKATEEMVSLWIDVESGRWKLPTPPEKKEKDSTKKYFGAR